MAHLRGRLVADEIEREVRNWLPETGIECTPAVTRCSPAASGIFPAGVGPLDRRIRRPFPVPTTAAKTAICNDRKPEVRSVYTTFQLGRLPARIERQRARERARAVGTIDRPRISALSGNALRKTVVALLEGDNDGARRAWTIDISACHIDFRDMPCLSGRYEEIVSRDIVILRIGGLEILRVHAVADVAVLVIQNARRWPAL